MQIFKNRIGKFILASLIVLGFSGSLYGEINYLAPSISKMNIITTSDYEFSKRENLLFANNNLVYNINSINSINKYLTLKTVASSAELNSEYSKDIENLEQNWLKTQDLLKSLSIEEKIKNSLESAITAAIANQGLETISTKKINYCSFLINVMNTISSNDSNKRNITNIMNMTSEDYDSYQKTVIFISELATKNNSICEASRINLSQINELAKNSAGIMISALKIYQGFLDTASLGSTLGGMYRLAITQNAINENLLALSFIHDYSLRYNGDILAMAKYLPKVFYVNNSSKIVFEKPYSDAIPYKVTIADFFDIFYWYTLKNTSKFLDINIGTAEFGGLDTIVSSARKSLEYIEDYGNGGNFSIISNSSLSEDLKKYFKYSSIIENRNKEINKLYYMNKKEASTFQNYFWKDFYPLGKLSFVHVFIPGGLSKSIKFIPDFKESTIAFDLNIIQIHDDIKTIVLDNNDTFGIENTYINHSIKPEVTIQYKNKSGVNIEVQNLNYDRAIFIPSGFPSDINSINFGSEALSSIYNAGAINIYTDRFYPNKYISSGDLIKMFYVYLKDISISDSDIVNLNEFSWDKCKVDNICGDGKIIQNQTSFISHKDFISILVNKINFNNNKTIRKFDSLRFDKNTWTPEAIELFELGVYNDIIGNVNQNRFVTNIEAIVIMHNVKKLIKKGK